eukprot:CAMPEP_0179244486 /NCGR_PEP_ID=MMETSP0797-20121207/18080_1 /TAXON_ID=47934 /ORGANISM="Dinophysis acuminata, Strain DAEP01" /LENGTH=68 /DNA_ID=CAMNT_0020951999 /DNA_START=245 /DNA_END=447 /DNA_ORIENTATION=+
MPGTSCAGRGSPKLCRSTALKPCRHVKQAGQGRETVHGVLEAFLLARLTMHRAPVLRISAHPRSWPGG